MAGLIGKKVGMTQIFNENGDVIPVTVLEVGPCFVTQIKNKEVDEYESLQLGFGKKKLKNTTKPLQGHFKKAKIEAVAKLAEFKFQDISSFELGQTISVNDIFNEGDKVKITGKSKGHGFAGVIKRHGFGGGRASHGSRSHRIPGSIGMCATPSRVLKGKKMPGHFGNETVSVMNLEVVKVYPEKNLMMVKGAVPGHRDGYLKIYKLNK